VARPIDIEFVDDRLAGARLVRAYAVLAPERRGVTGNEGSDSERHGRAGGLATGEGRGDLRAGVLRAPTQEQTIQSQTVALRELAEQRELLVPEELVFEDFGFSGASLRRPALERLRDRAVEGYFEVVLCYAPDRLAVERR
jgi:hypothetical protein